MMFRQLAMWHISGRDTEVNIFWRKLQTSCSNCEESKPTNHMTHRSPTGNASVFSGPISSPVTEVANFWHIYTRKAISIAPQIPIDLPSLQYMTELEES